MLVFMSHISVFIHYTIKIDQVYEITWWGGNISQFLYTRTWKIIIFKVYLSMIGFEKSYKLCWKHEMFYFNDKIKEYIFVNKCQIHNTNQEKVETFMFTLLILDFSWYIFCGCFMSKICLFFFLRYIWK